MSGWWHMCQQHRAEAILSPETEMWVPGLLLDTEERGEESSVGMSTNLIFYIDYCYKELIILENWENWFPYVLSETEWHK